MVFHVYLSQNCVDSNVFCTYVQGNGLMRILYVAAFAVSGYASTDSRPCKPFNPLLGETYEADYPEKGIRFFSEKVSLVYNTSAFCHAIQCTVTRSNSFVKK